MNERALDIVLVNYMDRADGWGHEEGRKVHDRLLRIVEDHPGTRVFRVSLAGINRMDASFPRESLAELARRYRGDKGFCLTNIDDEDLLDNWDAGATKKNQPLMVWNNNDYRIIGPQPSKGNVEMLDYALKRDFVTTADAANNLDLKLPNASTKLKQLHEKGFLLRREEAAASGGVEYLYFRIK